MQVIVDIGLQKTGSKARQQFFATHLDRVAHRRVLYPAAGRQGVWHRPLYDALCRGERAPLGTLAAEVAGRAEDADLAIVSYEELYKLGAEQIGWLKESLGDLVAIVFLRRQDQLVNSFHNQLHKSHRVPLEAIERFESGMLDYDRAYDHRATLERWIGVLGRSAVRPILFDKRDSSVVAFWRRADIAVDFEGYGETYPNRAMDAFGLAVLRWVKRLTADETALPEVMNEAHRRLAAHWIAQAVDQDIYSLSLAERARVMAHYEASNEWVRQELFPDRPALFAPLEPGAPVRPDYTQGRELALEIVAAARAARGG